MEVMHVIKRDGTKETVSFDKVSNRLNKLIQGDGNQKTLKVDYISLAQKVCGDMYSGVHTYELDELSAQTCAGLITECVDYGILANVLRFQTIIKGLPHHLVKLFKIYMKAQIS